MEKKGANLKLARPFLTPFFYSQSMQQKADQLNTSIDMNVSIRLSGVDGMQIEGMDYLGLSQQPKFQQMIGACKIISSCSYAIEKLYFSDKIKKINMFGWVQQRYLLITNEKIYNIKKTKIKRSIRVSDYLCLIHRLDQ